VRCAKFSQDGQLVATGSSDGSIKILEVRRMHYQGQIQDFQSDRQRDEKSDYSGGSSNRPLLRTFQDHLYALNEVDFHPIETYVASCSKDCSIRFFDHSKPGVKSSYKTIYDCYNIRSIHFHPSGDFLLASSDHPLIRLYDVNTFQSFVSQDKRKHHTAPVTQVRYSAQGNLYASASMDGSIKIWDTISSKCINTIRNAHSGAPVSSVQFSPSSKYLLSGGQDSTSRLWDLSTGRQVMLYSGAVHRNYRLQTAFTLTGDHVLSADEETFDTVAWDTRTGELVGRLQGHTRAVRYIAVSPSEPAFISCSEDMRSRFWAAPPED